MGAKVRLSEQKTKLYLDFFEVHPIFDEVKDTIIPHSLAFHP